MTWPHLAGVFSAGYISHSGRNVWPFGLSDNKIKTRKLSLCVWPALRNPAERSASSRPENTEKYKHPRVGAPTRALAKEREGERERVENTLSVWKGQGVWINSDRATGIRTQMAHNLPSPLNYAVWLPRSLPPTPARPCSLARITARRSFGPGQTEPRHTPVTQLRAEPGSNPRKAPHQLNIIVFHYSI